MIVLHIHIHTIIKIVNDVLFVCTDFPTTPDECKEFRWHWSSEATGGGGSMLSGGSRMNFRSGRKIGAYEKYK